MISMPWLSESCSSSSMLILVTGNGPAPGLRNCLVGCFDLPAVATREPSNPPGRSFRPDHFIKLFSVHIHSCHTASSFPLFDISIPGPVLDFRDKVTVAEIHGETGGWSLVLSGQGGGRRGGRADQKDGVPGESGLQAKKTAVQPGCIAVSSMK